MECEIDERVERKCSTCIYGHCDEDEEPCPTCCDSMIPFSQWVFAPDDVIHEG